MKTVTSRQKLTRVNQTILLRPGRRGRRTWPKPTCSLANNRQSSSVRRATSSPEGRERVREFLFSELMAEVVRAALGESAYLFNEQYVVKAAEKGLKFGWHQDSGFVGYPHRPYLSCWCAIDDVTVENGTVYLLPYSRAGTREVVEHVKDEETNDLVGYFGDDPGDPVVARAGSIACFSSVCFHRSGANETDQPRRVYLAQYSAEPIMTEDGSRVRHLAKPFLEGGKRVGNVV